MEMVELAGQIEKLEGSDRAINSLVADLLWPGERIFTNADGSKDVHSATFGFRWFAPTGLGKNAIFRLNGRRIKIVSRDAQLTQRRAGTADRLGTACTGYPA